MNLSVKMSNTSKHKTIQLEVLQRATQRKHCTNDKLQVLVQTTSSVNIEDTGGVVSVWIRNAVNLLSAGEPLSRVKSCGLKYKGVVYSLGRTSRSKVKDIHNIAPTALLYQHLTTGIQSLKCYISDFKYWWYFIYNLNQLTVLEFIIMDELISISNQRILMQGLQKESGCLLSQSTLRASTTLGMACRIWSSSIRGPTTEPPTFYSQRNQSLHMKTN